MYFAAKPKDNNEDTLKMWPPPAPPPSSTTLHSPQPLLPGDGLEEREVTHRVEDGEHLQRQSSSGEGMPGNFVRSESTNSGGLQRQGM